MKCTVLPHKLTVIKVLRSNLQLCAHAFMQLFLNENGHLPFLSLTETSEELSFLAPLEVLSEFPPGAYESSGKQTFRPLEITCVDIQGKSVVHSVSEPLAKAGISIFYISTYQTNLTLIHESKLQEALGILSKDFSIDYDVSTLPYTNVSTELQFSPGFVDGGTKKHKLRVLCKRPSVPVDVNLISLEHGQVPPTALAGLLLKLIFFPPTTKRFFSYTQFGGLISLVLCEFDKDEVAKLLGSFEGFFSFYSDIWNVISVNDGPLGFDEAGIVASLAKPLAHADISLFYMSAFTTDHILVRKQNFDSTIQILVRDGFKVDM